MEVTEYHATMHLVYPVVLAVSVAFAAAASDIMHGRQIRELEQRVRELEREVTDGPETKRSDQEL
jgi:hypothetical protein